MLRGSSKTQICVLRLGLGLEDPCRPIGLGLEGPAGAGLNWPRMALDMLALTTTLYTFLQHKIRFELPEQNN